MNYTLYAGWQQDSQVIDPNTIDWPRVSAKHFPYSIRQAPGSHNALGRYKFNMPNSEAIYLHDTPNQNLFNKDIRAFSSGCVRVNKAAELASILLNQVGWKENKIAATLQQGKTTYVPIRQRIPVKLYYLTAWVNDNAIAQYRTDIYDYDSMVNESVESIAQIRSLIR
jgi:murein L,D-transpeptidase YcbB/YkuD